MFSSFLAGSLFSLLSAIVLTFLTVSLLPMMETVMPVMLVTLTGAGTGISLFFSRASDK